MIAADDEKRDLQFGRDFGRDLIKEGDRLRRRKAPVIDVTGKDNGVDSFVFNERQELSF